MEETVPFLKPSVSAVSGLFRVPGSQHDFPRNALQQCGRDGCPPLPWTEGAGVYKAALTCVQLLTSTPTPISRHLDISRDRLSSYYKFKLTRKVLSLFVQKLGNLMSLDISGHMILENCSISKMDEEAGQTRWGCTRHACCGYHSTSISQAPLCQVLFWVLEIRKRVRPCPLQSV